MLIINSDLKLWEWKCLITKEKLLEKINDNVDLKEFIWINNELLLNNISSLPENTDMFEVIWQDKNQLEYQWWYVFKIYNDTLLEIISTSKS